MAPMTATERQKLLLQQEIAKLSGAISRHATSHTSSHSHSSNFHPYRGRHPQRGSAFRGRGRGGKAYGLDLRAANKAAASAAATGDSYPTSSTSSTAGPSIATANESSSRAVEREAGEVSPPKPTPKPAAADAEESWVKKTSKGGNMSLMTKEKSDQLQSRPPALRRRVPKVPPQIQVLNSTTSETGPKKVIIDGVIFQFEEDGKKLTRIGEVAPAVGSSSSHGTPTRKRLEYGGQQFRRTSKGNLISSASKAKLAKKYCRYYTKTGRCDRALTCPYIHDPSRISICPRFLRHICPFPSGQCPLSHTPSAHNTPSCVHFQATSTCRNGPACLYPHVRVSTDAPVCEAFAREGWCDREEGTCPELHTWECGEWREKGTCSRGKRCGLRHVLRAERGRASQAEADRDGLDGDQAVDSGDFGDVSLPVEGGFEDGASFIGLGPGSPVWSSDENESEGEDDDEGSGAGSDEELVQDEEESVVVVQSAEALAVKGKGKAAASDSHVAGAVAAAEHDVYDASMETDDEADEDAVLGVVL